MGTVILSNFETAVYYTGKSNVIDLTAAVICNLKRFYRRRANKRRTRK